MFADKKVDVTKKRSVVVRYRPKARRTGMHLRIMQIGMQGSNGEKASWIVQATSNTGISVAILRRVQLSQTDRVIQADR